MARKKREPGGEKPKRRRQRPADLPDRRALEGVMRDVVRSLHGEVGQPTTLDQAHDILLRAYQEPDELRRVQLAQDALAVCPDRADAYVLLAEHATSRPEALRLPNVSQSLIPWECLEAGHPRATRRSASPWPWWGSQGR